MSIKESESWEEARQLFAEMQHAAVRTGQSGFYEMVALGHIEQILENLKGEEGR